MFNFFCKTLQHPKINPGSAPDGPKDNSTDYVRYRFYTLTNGCFDAKANPPCSYSLKRHTSRANYQTYIWRNGLQQHPQIPPPHGYGWNQDGDDVISFK